MVIKHGVSGIDTKFAAVEKRKLCIMSQQLPHRRRWSTTVTTGLAFDLLKANSRVNCRWECRKQVSCNKVTVESKHTVKRILWECRSTAHFFLDLLEVSLAFVNYRQFACSVLFLEAHIIANAGYRSYMILFHCSRVSLNPVYRVEAEMITCW